MNYYVPNSMKGLVKFEPYGYQQNLLSRYDQFDLNLVYSVRQMGITTVNYIFALEQAKKGNKVAIFTNNNAMKQSIIESLSVNCGQTCANIEVHVVTTFFDVCNDVDFDTIIIENASLVSDSILTKIIEYGVEIFDGKFIMTSNGTPTFRNVFFDHLTDIRFKKSFIRNFLRPEFDDTFKNRQVRMLGEEAYKSQYILAKAKK